MNWNEKMYIFSKPVILRSVSDEESFKELILLRSFVSLRMTKWRVLMPLLLLASLMFLCSTANADVARLQSVSQNCSGSTSCTVNIAKVQPGDLIVVTSLILDGRAQAAPTVKDNLLNTYTNIWNIAVGGWYSYNMNYFLTPASMPALTSITVTDYTSAPNPTEQGISVIVAEYSGIASNPLDVSITPGATGFGTTYSIPSQSPTVTTSSANELLVGGVFNYSTVGVVFTGTNGWTNFATQNNYPSGNTISMQDQGVTSNVSYTNTLPLPVIGTATAGSNFVGMASFKTTSAPAVNIPTAFPSVNRTFYIAANGDDSNDGRTISSAWLHAPGMNGCSAICHSTIPQPGDSFIFRGGDTWHASTGTPIGLNWTWIWTGTSGNPIYIGVDNTTIGLENSTSKGWYNPNLSQWARPIMDLDNSPSTRQVASCTYDDTAFSAVDIGTGYPLSYVTFDNFEFTGLCWSTPPAFNQATYLVRIGTNITISNSYFHGWTHTACFDGDQYCDSACLIGGATNYNGEGIGINNNVISGNTFDGSDGDGQSAYAVYADAYDFHNNIVRYMSNGPVANNIHTVHDNLFEHMNNSYDTTMHSNALLANFEAPSNNYYYNNIFRYIGTAINIWTFPASGYNDYYYNNIIYGITNGTPGVPSGNCWDIVGANSPSVYFINNTFEAPCFIRNTGLPNNSFGPPFTGNEYYYNNHFIGYAGFSSVTSTGDNGADAILHEGVDIYQTESSANLQGYVPANNYAPITNSGSTVGRGSTVAAGQNLTSLGVTMGLPAAFSTDINGTSRPASGNWDAGAYQLGNVYYIDYVNGNDNNSGTSEASPWQHAPGMLVNGSPVTLPYTHQAGDHFIFKGGVTWPYSVFVWNITNSGTAGNPDYYGVDQTWYDSTQCGASFCRPIFDAGGPSHPSHKMIDSSYNSNITLDNFEFTDFYWNSSTDGFMTSMIIGYESTNILIENSYFHNWSHSPCTSHDSTGYCTENVFTVSGITTWPTAGATYTNNNMTYTVVSDTGSGTSGTITTVSNTPLGCSASTQDCEAPTASGTLTLASGTGDAAISFSSVYTGSSDSLNIIYVQGTTLNDTFDGSPNGTDSGQASTTANVINSIARNMSNGFLPTNGSGPCIISGNQIGPINTSYAGNHENAIEPEGGITSCVPTYIFDNVIQGSVGVTTLLGSDAAPIVYIYDNLFYNSLSIPIQLDGRGAAPDHIANVYNNTMTGYGGVCLRTISTWQYLDYENNQCIGDINDGNNGLSFASMPLTYINNNNLYQSTVTATADGYTLSNNYMPTSVTSPTVGAGVSLGQIAFPSLNSDLLGNPRPGGSAAWDIGAYQYTGNPSSSILYGDVNGAVNGSGQPIVTLYDAELTAQAAVGLITLTSTQQQAADVDGKGATNIYDAYLIAEYAAGLITKFPAQ